MRLSVINPPTRHHSGIITGLVFSISGDVLYSSSASGSLAMYDTSDERNSQVLRLMSSTVAKGESCAARALSLSEDGTRLAFIGPLDFTITVLNATTLEEVSFYYLFVFHYATMEPPMV